MMELIEWAINETLKETLSRSVATDDVRKGLTLFVNNTLRYRVMVKKLMESSKRAQIERVFMQISEAYFRENLKRWDTCFRSKDDLEFIATFCAYGVTGILLENCHKEEVNKEQLVDQLYHLWTRHFLKYFEENSL